MMENNLYANRLANDITNFPQHTTVKPFATNRRNGRSNSATTPEETPVLGLGVNTKTRDNGSMSYNLLEFNEVCSLLKIGRSTLYGLVNSKTIKAVKLLGRTLFRESDIYEFVATLPEYEGGPNGF